MSGTDSTTPEILLASPGWASQGGAHLWRPLRDQGPIPPGLAASAPATRAGQWTLIEHDGEDLVLTTDRPRSHHLLFTRLEGRWVVSDDSRLLRERLPARAWRRDASAAEAFLHLGFAPGTSTLIDGVHATPAASTTILRADGTWSSRAWEEYRFDPSSISESEEYAEAFTAAMDAAVARLLDAVGDRQLVLPLSGGLDSRLLAAWLMRLGAGRIATFTYGKASARETAVSQQVAEAMGLPWFSVELDPAEVASAWAGPGGAGFQASTWGATSLPHPQDWYALRRIRDEGLVDDDAVFLPGHTIVGNMHDEQLLGASPALTTVLTAIASHHAILQGRKRAYARLPLLRRAVTDAVRELGVGADLAPRDIQRLIEWFNLRERQAKYINNSMKGYEAFGYDWALPMLDRELWEVWLRGSEELTATRQWYARFTARAYAEATGQETALFAPPSTRLPALPRRVLLAGLRATRGDKALSRYRSVRTMLDHPMAFEAFSAPIPRLEQVARMSLGASTLGLWTRLFLDGRWGAGIVPEE